jgi:hypothetical protein
VVTRNTLECGLNWARRSFDELILPATSVSLFARNLFLRFSDSFEKCDLFLSCSGQTLVASGRRRARATRPAGDAACRSSGGGSRSGDE